MKNSIVKGLKFILIKIAVTGFIAGGLCIIAALVFYKEGKNEGTWLIVFASGAILILNWLIVTFLVSRCHMCGAFNTVKNMTLLDGRYYCPVCIELVRSQDKIFKPGSSMKM
jgi:hypothetical protein